MILLWYFVSTDRATDLTVNDFESLVVINALKQPNTK